MKRWLIACTVASALVVTGCGGTSSRPTEGRLTAHGDVVVVRPAGLATEVRDTVSLQPGDVVQVRSGDASVVLAHGSSVAMRTGSMTRFAGGPQLMAGDLLVKAPTKPLVVGTALGGVSVAGVSRMRRDLVLTIGSYQGAATVTTAARTLVIPALRQASVAAVGLLPDGAAPLSLNSLDPWDREFLGKAIDLTAQLDESSRGFTAEVPAGTGQNAAFYRRALSPLDSQPQFSDALLRSTATTLGPRSPGELLVGVSIDLAGADRPFAERWQQIWDFRDQGAAWGLVALDQATDGARVLNLVAQAIGSSILVFSAPATPPNPGPGTELLAPLPRQAPTTSTSSPRRRSPGPSPNPSPGPTPTLPQPPPPPPNVIGQLLDPILQLLAPPTTLKS